MSSNGWTLNKATLTIILIVIIFSSISFADCNIPDAISWTIEEDAKVICTSEKDLYNTNEIEKLIINGTLILNNSRFRFKHDVEPRIIVNGNLTLINGSHINASQINTNADGNLTLNASKDSSIKIEDSSIINIKLLDMNSSHFSAINSTLNFTKTNRGMYLENMADYNLDLIEIIKPKNIILNNCTNSVISESNISLYNITINQSNKVIFSDLLLKNLTSNPKIDFKNTNMTINNINIDNFTKNLTNSSNITFIDSNASLSILDENSSLYQKWTIIYFIKDDKGILMSGVDLYSNSSRGNISYTRKSDINGKIQIPFLSYYKNNTGITYYSNYTSNFSKSHYKNTMNKINVTEEKTKIILMKTKKGYIKTGTGCISSFFFCGDRNPIQSSGCYNMHSGDACTVTFTINATDNAVGDDTYMVNESFLFFTITEPLDYGIISKESARVNITIVK